MKAQALVGQHDMKLGQALGNQGWTRTHLIQKGERNLRAVFLTECEVNDPARFGYLNGAWWRLEAPTFEGNRNSAFSAPRTQTYSDDYGSYTLVECSNTDANKLFYTDGSYWKKQD